MRSFGAEDGDDGFEGGGPVGRSRGGVGAEGLDVEGDGESFLGTGEVDERGADDAVEHGVGLVEALGAAHEAMDELTILMGRREEGAVAEEEIDVAGESGEGGGGAEAWVEIEIEREAKLLELFGGEGPGVAFGGEDGRAGGVEGAEGVHEGREALGLGEMVEVVGVCAEIDEVRGGVRGVGPGNFQGGIVGGALCGPFGKHLYLS